MAKGQQQSQKVSRTNESAAILDQPESPFRFYIPGDKPKTDQAYFELLMFKLARAKGDLPDFESVWPRAVQALAGMNLLRLSTYSHAEVHDSIAAVGGEFAARMTPHAESITHWAASLWRIRQVYGTIRRYLRSFEADGFESMLDDVRERLPGLTPEFLTAYLRDAGEKAPVPERQPSGRLQQRPSVPQESRGGGQERRQQAQTQQQSDKQDEDRQGRGDRRRRQRGRGQRPNPQPQGTKPQPAQQSPGTPISAASGDQSNDPAKDPQQQQRRRNRRRFFRRRRSGGDKQASPPASQ